MSRFLKYASYLLTLSIVMCSVFFYQSYHQFVSEPLELAPQNRIFDVTDGMGFIQLTSQLESPQWTIRKFYWRLLGWQMGVAERIQKGEYELPVGITPQQLLHKLVMGDVKFYQFTIVEGWSFKQLRLQLAADANLTSQIAELSDQSIMQLLGKADWHPEGWFLPETYQFVKGDTDFQILERAFASMQHYLGSIWPHRDVGLPYQEAYQALIMASIIEKETGLAQERHKIAGVFIRRLDQGMRLQTDPTVIYGLGDDYTGRIRYKDLRFDTAYNTYTRHGLPPTPIALPSKMALEAALQPEDGKELYFVAKGDGSHFFSESLFEHNNAVNRYQRNQKGQP